MECTRKSIYCEAKELAADLNSGDPRLLEPNETKIFVGRAAEIEAYINARLKYLGPNTKVYVEFLTVFDYADENEDGEVVDDDIPHHYFSMTIEDSSKIYTRDLSCPLSVTDDEAFTFLTLGLIQNLLPGNAKNIIW